MDGFLNSCKFLNARSSFMEYQVGIMVSIINITNDNDQFYCNSIIMKK